MTYPKRALFIFTFAGLLFSGYMSAIKLFTGTCAFNESCPYFLGYPACWYGFAMYLLMFAVAVLVIAKKISDPKALRITLGVSILGVLFSGSFAVLEIMQSGLIAGRLGVSTCVYGLFFYLLIAGWTVKAYIKK
ncbi:MAG: hypothetical protein V1489_03085 [Candidatus Liptonbacteria bacterium]